MYEAHELAVGGCRDPPRMQPEDVVPTSCPVCKKWEQNIDLVHFARFDSGRMQGAICPQVKRSHDFLYRDQQARLSVIAPVNSLV